MDRTNKNKRRAAVESSSPSFTKIKAAYLKTVIGFNNSGQPLGERSDSDLIDLAIMARESGNKNLLRLFARPLPKLEDLKRARMQAIEATLKATTTTATHVTRSNHNEEK